MAQNLVSLGSVKSYLNISDNTEHDGFLKRLINVVSDFIQLNYIGRELTAKERTEYYDGKGKNQIHLKHYPIISITDIWDDPSRNYTDTYKKSSDDYVYYEDNGIIKLIAGGVFYDGIKNVKATYIAGYNSVPGDIQQATIELVARKYDQSRKGKGQLGIDSISAGDQTVNYNQDDLLPQIKSVLLAYRGYRV